MSAVPGTTEPWHPGAESPTRCYLAYALIAALLVPPALVIVLHKVPDTDEFSLFYGAAARQVFLDIPNNPPLFNLIAAAIQSTAPTPWPFFIPAVVTLIVGLTTVRVGARAGLTPLSIACALAVDLRGWIELATQYRSYALLVMLLLLAFAAWDGGNARRFFVFGLLASLTHHLGSFVGVALAVGSRVVGPPLPWWTVVAFVPGLCIAASGFQQKHQGATWGLHFAMVDPYWLLGMALSLCLLFTHRAGGVMKRLVFWSLAQYAVLLALWLVIPMRRQYLWISLVPTTLLLAAVFKMAQDRFGRTARVIVIPAAILILLGVADAAGFVASRLEDDRQLSAFEEELRARHAGRERLLFYPASELALVHHAFDGFRSPAHYTVEGLREKVGPFEEVEAPASAGPAMGNAELIRFAAPNGARLDAAALRQPLTVPGDYDCLVLRDDYPDAIVIPNGYVRLRSVGRYDLFVPVARR